MNTKKSFPSPAVYVAGNRAEIMAGDYMVLPPEIDAHPAILIYGTGMSKFS